MLWRMCRSLDLSVALLYALPPTHMPPTLDYYPCILHLLTGTPSHVCVPRLLCFPQVPSAVRDARWLFPSLFGFSFSPLAHPRTSLYRSHSFPLIPISPNHSSHIGTHARYNGTLSKLTIRCIHFLSVSD